MQKYSVVLVYVLIMILLTIKIQSPPTPYLYALVKNRIQYSVQFLIPMVRQRRKKNMVKRTAKYGYMICIEDNVDKILPLLSEYTKREILLKYKAKSISKHLLLRYIDYLYNNGEYSIELNINNTIYNAYLFMYDINDEDVNYDDERNSHYILFDDTELFILKPKPLLCDLLKLHIEPVERLWIEKK